MRGNKKSPRPSGQLYYNISVSQCQHEEYYTYYFYNSSCTVNSKFNFNDLEVIIMGYTSTQVKARYNKKAYKQFNVQIKPELFNRIDDYCKLNNLSRSEFLLKAIEKLAED